ncbi:histone-like nucleoid-structuring protein Lsr2 [Streptomyces sp. NPDC004732]|uniref:Lsr2 family DNA-binding protein n=1 Tax=Streptomyces sp. NPDC004732 TaxID=3154290 RepID=UPI0033ABB7CC
MAIKAATVTKLTVEIGDEVYEGEVEISDAKMKELETASTAFEKAQNAYLAAADKFRAKVEEVGLEPKKKGRRNATMDTKIRAWAKDNDIEVNDRGRIPSNITAAYELAMKEAEEKPSAAKKK